MTEEKELDAGEVLLRSFEIIHERIDQNDRAIIILTVYIGIWTILSTLSNLLLQPAMNVRI